MAGTDAYGLIACAGAALLLYLIYKVFFDD